MKWFYSLSRQKTFVGGKCALPSTLLVFVAMSSMFALYTPLSDYNIPLHTERSLAVVYASETER